MASSTAFPVPVLAVFTLERHPADRLVELMQKAELCAHTEVGDGQEAQLFEHELARQLNLNRCGREEVLQGERSNLHDVANVERVDPLVLVQVSQDVLHVCVAHLQGHAAAQSRVSLRLRRLDDVGGGED
eukprot:CAMPEP_0170453494 /NCGR_PEP_ID=MMETSP0123-20130129/2059_1 /TAXON_ID=182087 /ORGANISM="Favella ehrenbergii, Strain Fehren 1" /LENGTH=129 /DNA_ID=CAMNT_0010715889 /DNA_START=3398 /DNA_END=3786 /DNA_ORIENTATION=-